MGKPGQRPIANGRPSAPRWPASNQRLIGRRGGWGLCGGDPRTLCGVDGEEGGEEREHRTAVLAVLYSAGEGVTSSRARAAGQSGRDGGRRV